MPKNTPPELTFQKHVADYLVHKHGYGVLEQSDITDAEHFIAEDHLWVFLKATQADTLKKLTDDYGTDARDEVLEALRKELTHTPLRMLFRHGLKVRGLELRLFYPKPRSSWCACPNAKPRPTSRSGRRSPSCPATTRAAWCEKWPTMPQRISRHPARSAGNT